MPVRGGKRLAAHLRQMRRQSDRLHGRTIEAGFLEPHIAGLAVSHEFGHGDIPPRPAFSRAENDAKRAIRQHLKRLPGLPENSDLEAAGEAAAEVIRESYQDAPGPALSERQEARKEGTPGAGRKLVGHEGEKLIGHIRSRVVDRPGD